MTVQCISLFGLRELTPASKFTKTGDDLLPTQVYHPTDFHRPASTQASDIHYKNLQTSKQRNSKRYIPKHAYQHVGTKLIFCISAHYVAKLALVNYMTVSMLFQITHMYYSQHSDLRHSGTIYIWYQRIHPYLK